MDVVDSVSPHLLLAGLAARVMATGGAAETKKLDLTKEVIWYSNLVATTDFFHIAVVCAY